MRSHLRSALIGIAAAALVASGGVTAAQAADTPPNSTSKPGYTLDFAEEFDGTELDTTRWLPNYLPHWVAPENLDDTAARYTVSDGTIKLRVEQDQPPWNPDQDGTVVSSAIQSYNANSWHRFNDSAVNRSNLPTFDGYTTQYGYFEVRAKLSNAGGGGHQAVWLVGTNSTGGQSEIDFIETFFSTPDKWRIAAYGWGDPDFVSSWTGDTVPVSGTPTEEFHLYAMDWTPWELKFYYDGQLVKTINDAPNTAMGLIMNIYTGAGSGAPNNVWPKQFEVDYLRVFKKDGGYPASAYELIKNRQSGQYLHIENKTGNVQAGTVPTTYWSAQWKQETTSAGYMRFKNRWTGEYMHTENATGNVKYGSVNTGWWSADWTKESVDGYTRIKNRNNGGYVHTENQTGTAQYGSVPSTYWSSQWSFQPAQ